MLAKRRTPKLTNLAKFDTTSIKITSGAIVRSVPVGRKPATAAKPPRMVAVMKHKKNIVKLKQKGAARLPVAVKENGRIPTRLNISTQKNIAEKLIQERENFSPAPEYISAPIEPTKRAAARAKTAAQLKNKAAVRTKIRAANRRDSGPGIINCSNKSAAKKIPHRIACTRRLVSAAIKAFTNKRTCASNQRVSAMWNIMTKIIDAVSAAEMIVRLLKI